MKKKTCGNCRYKDQLFSVCSEYLFACGHGRCMVGVRPADPESGRKYDYFECCVKHVPMQENGKEDGIQEKSQYIRSRKGQIKEFVLLQDIVIPKGTVFSPAPIKTERSPDHFECTIGLSKNTYGTITYCLDEEDQNELQDFFTELK